MTIHEFGKINKKIVLLIHPSIVKWDYFEYVIPLLEKEYHLVIPAIPGYDFDNESDFTSVEEIAHELNEWMIKNEYKEIYAVYGCSMGGSISLLFTLENKIQIQHCIMDGGITPYQLPWIITRFIALKDYCMMMLGRYGGIRLLEKAFATDNYSKEDLQYVVDVLRHCSRKTIWRTFDYSLNIDNYDTIFIGYPIWWGDVPMIINTFLEKYDFSGKTIIPFNTHEGSGNSGTYTSIKNKMSSSTVNTNGLAIQGKTARQESSRSTVENWLKGLGL